MTSERTWDVGESIVTPTSKAYSRPIKSIAKAVSAAIVVLGTMTVAKATSLDGFISSPRVVVDVVRAERADLQIKEVESPGPNDLRDVYKGMSTIRLSETFGRLFSPESEDEPEHEVFMLP